MTWEDIYGVVHGAVRTKQRDVDWEWSTSCDRRRIFTAHENTRERLRPYERTPLTCLWCVTRMRK